MVYHDTDNVCRNCGNDIKVTIFRSSGRCSVDCEKALEAKAAKDVELRKQFDLATSERESELSQYIDLQDVDAYDEGEKIFSKVDEGYDSMPSDTNVLVWSDNLGLRTVMHLPGAIEAWVQQAAECHADRIYFYKETDE